MIPINLELTRFRKKEIVEVLAVYRKGKSSPKSDVISVDVSNGYPEKLSQRGRNYYLLDDQKDIDYRLDLLVKLLPALNKI